MGELAGSPAEISPGVPDLSGPAAGHAPQASIWPHVEERIVDLIAEHRSTIVFANSRRLAERLDLAAQRDLGGAARRGGGAPVARPRGPLDPAARAGHGPGRAPGVVPRPCSPAPTTAR